MAFFLLPRKMVPPYSTNDDREQPVSMSAFLCAKMKKLWKQISTAYDLSLTNLPTRGNVNVIVMAVLWKYNGRVVAYLNQKNRSISLPFHLLFISWTEHVKKPTPISHRRFFFSFTARSLDPSSNHVWTSFTQCSSTTPVDEIRTYSNYTVLFRLFDACSQPQPFPPVCQCSTRNKHDDFHFITLVFWDLNCMHHQRIPCGLDRILVSGSTFTYRNICVMRTHSIVSYTGIIFTWSAEAWFDVHLVSMGRPCSILAQFLSCPSCVRSFPKVKHFV